MSRRNRSVLAWCACILLLPFLYLHGRRFAAHSSWDSLVYARAITSFLHGGTPYITMGKFIFVYPPAVPLAGRLLAQILTPHVGFIVFTLVNMISVAALPYIIGRFYLPQLVIGEAYLLYFLTPGFIVEPVFFGGNIAAPCYFAAMIAAIPGLKRGNWLWFYLAVIAIANVKITFLVLLLIPFLVGIRQFVPCAVTTMSTAGFYLLQKFSVPDLYRQFHDALAIQTFAGRDYGCGAFGATGNLLVRFNITGFAIPWAVQLAFTAAIVLVLWRVRGSVDLNNPRLLALVLIAVVLTNPRIQVYDSFLGIIPAYYLVFANVRRPLTWVLAGLGGLGFFIGHGALGFLFCLIAAFTIGVVDLGSSRGPHPIAASEVAPAAG